MYVIDALVCNQLAACPAIWPHGLGLLAAWMRPRPFAAQFRQIADY